jgi:hypothetical protein
VIKVGGLTTVVVATATAACGLLMLSGAGPSPAAADDERVPEPIVVVASSTEPPTAEPAVVADAAIVDSTPSSTTTTTTTTPTGPIPLNVAPRSITVGAGGTARISGECPVVDGSPLGPVVIWQIGSTVTPISTGVTAAAWSYDWTAPGEVEPLGLQVWCGDPSQYAGGYPESLQIEVVFVAQEAPTTTTTPTAAPPHDVIPETG